jgi:superfamily II DNA or RNA helicase
MKRYNNLAEEALGRVKTQLARRFFTRPERKAVARASNYTCEYCGTPAPSGHADHMIAWTNGGATALSNAAWACPSCNGSKGAQDATRAAYDAQKPAFAVKAFRAWQRDAIDSFGNSEARSFFIAAGVGSGKTFAALGAYLAGDFDLIIVLMPKTGIVGSWLDDAKKLGINLQALDSAAAFDGSRQQGKHHGYVLTNGLAGSAAYDIALLCSRYKVLAVMDEAHHLHEKGSWGKTASGAFANAARIIALSGTPYRADNSRIVELDYVTTGDDVADGAPDYTYSYGQALTDGVVAPVHCRIMGGEVTRYEADTGKREVYSYDDGDYSHVGGDKVKLMNNRLRNTTVFSLDWQMASIDEARREMMDMRKDGRNWGGLVVAYTVEQAKRLAKAITERYGDKVMLLVRDADTAKGVSKFQQDETYDWVVSITKVSEGVSIDRLRVSVYLSPVTSRSMFEQVRGRLARLERGPSPDAQFGLMFIPADPRLREYAAEVRDIINDTINLRLDDELNDGPDTKPRKTGLADQGDIDVEPMTLEQLKAYRDMVEQDLTPVSLGRFSLYARHEMDGTYSIDGYVTEEQWSALRENMRQFISPINLGRMSEGALKMLEAS